MPFFVYAVVLTNKIRLLQGKPASEKDLSMARCIFFDSYGEVAFKWVLFDTISLPLFSLHLKSILLKT